MNYEVAILYAKQRMRELKKEPCDYHYEPVYICPTVDEEASGHFYRLAYNEIYILVNEENYFGLQIISDNSSFNSEDATQNGVPEFTGKIQFNKIAEPWNLVPAPRPSVGKYGGIGDEETLIYGFVEFLRIVIY